MILLRYTKIMHRLGILYRCQCWRFLYCGEFITQR